MNKSTLMALVVFAGLAVATLATLREKPERGVSRLSLEHVDAAAVDKLVLGEGEDEVALEKSDGVWRIDGVRADGTAIDRVVESLAAVRSSDLASRNAERYADLEVDDEKGKRVRVFSGGEELADLVIGGASQGGAYVRAGDEVYTVPRLYRASFARDRSGWIEKRAFFDDVEDVEKVRATLGGEAFSIVEKDGAWALEDPSLLPADQRFDADRAQQWVRSLVTLRAAEVLETEPEDSGLAQSSDKVEFFVRGDAAARSLVFGGGDETNVYARSSERQRVLSLRAGNAKRVRLSLAELRDMSVVEVDPARASRIEIVDGEERLILAKGDAGWSIAESSQAVADDFDLDQGAVARRLAAIARLAGVAEAPAGVDSASATQIVKITQGDDVVSVAFGGESKHEERDVVESVGGGKTYLVAKSARDRIVAGLDSFARREAPPAGGLGGIDPEALKNLPPEVRDSLLKKMAEERQREEMMKRALEAAGK